jgi:pimeloyl-ACP methyl ester carboxylesterase
MLSSRRLLGAAAAAVDLAVRRAALTRTGGQEIADTLRHELRIALLRRLQTRYRNAGAAEHFFREPRRIHPRLDVRRPMKDGYTVVDAHWPSDYQAFLPEVQEQFDRSEANQIATARLVLHHEPRPLAILIHGYLGGVHRAERRIWPVSFLRRIGMDVALFVLPFHGPRSRGRFGEKPPFPGADPRMTNEGFRQAMADFRDLVGFLFERGHPKIGVMGMSLGGFSTALAATLEPRLAFAIPIIPLASIADVALLNGNLGPDPHQAELQYTALDEVYEITSPLHRPAAIPSDSILIIAGERDQITPIAHARKLARHFDCQLETMHGGHLVQLGRNEAFRKIGRFLNHRGVVSRRHYR